MKTNSEGLSTPLALEDQVHALRELEKRQIDTSPTALRALADSWSPDVDAVPMMAEALRAVADEKEQLVGLEEEFRKMIAEAAVVRSKETPINVPQGYVTGADAMVILQRDGYLKGHCPALTAELAEAGAKLMKFVDAQGGVGERPMIPAWLPIATVPVDEEVDLWADGERYTNCQHKYTMRDGGRWFMDGYDKYSNHSRVEVEKPTHWMRVPEGPKT